MCISCNINQSKCKFSIADSYDIRTTLDPLITISRAPPFLVSHLLIDICSYIINVDFCDLYSKNLHSPRFSTTNLTNIPFDALSRSVSCSTLATDLTCH